MKLTARSGLGAVAIVVGDALRREGIRAVLTGGACANLYTGGRHQSVDADFIVDSPTSRAVIERVMEHIGFIRKGDRYVHPRARFYVEFPRGPLAIGNDYRIRPAERVAVRIAVAHRVSIAKIRKWSVDEGASEEFAQFAMELKRARARGEGR